jgi:hypothetical protein
MRSMRSTVRTSFPKKHDEDLTKPALTARRTAVCLVAGAMLFGLAGCKIQISPPKCLGFQCDSFADKDSRGP